MSDSRAIVTRQPAGGIADIQSLELYAKMAKYVADSGLFQCKNPAEAFVKIVAGAEMGFPAIAAMTDIHIIEGKPSVGAHLMAAAIRRSGKYDYKIRELSDAVCSVAFFRDENGKMVEQGVITTTYQEALDKGWTVTKKGEPKMPWVQKPKNMLFARTISDGYKHFCPDLTGGMLVYDRDEIESEPVSPAVQVVTQHPANQLEYSPPADNSIGLTVNDDGSLRSELDDLTEIRNRCEALIRELGFSPEESRKRLQTAFHVETVTQIDNLGILRKLETSLNNLKAKRQNGANQPVAANAQA